MQPPDSRIRASCQPEMVSVTNCSGRDDNRYCNGSSRRSKWQLGNSATSYEMVLAESAGCCSQNSVLPFLVSEHNLNLQPLSNENFVPRLMD
jgi:hypothetical protein